VTLTIAVLLSPTRDERPSDDIGAMIDEVIAC
jgi:hypothetical protein